MQLVKPWIRLSMAALCTGALLSPGDSHQERLLLRCINLYVQHIIIPQICMAQLHCPPSSDRRVGNFSGKDAGLADSLSTTGPSE
jgi:hypothetical protein